MKDDKNHSGCIFCDPEMDVIASNDHAYAIMDGFPVSEGHALVISKRHTETWFDLTTEEQDAIRDLIIQVKRSLQLRFNPDGWNVGFNAGKAAGQTIFHTHIHLIPRYEGDVDDPTGGVRGVLTGMGRY